MYFQRKSHGKTNTYTPPEKIFVLCHKAFTRLQALKTSNLVEEGSHSPLRFSPFWRAYIFPSKTHQSKVKHMTILQECASEAKPWETTCVHSQCCLLWSKGSEPVLSRECVCECVCVCVTGVGYVASSCKGDRGDACLKAWPAPTTQTNTL